MVNQHPVYFYFTNENLLHLCSYVDVFLMDMLLYGRDRLTTTSNEYYLSLI
jgi:hypothetical protein